MGKVMIDGKTVTFEEGTTWEALAKRLQGAYAHRIVLAIADGKIRELFREAEDGASVTFLTTADRIGHDTYVRSLTMLFVKAVSDAAGSVKAGKVRIEFAIGRGYYAQPRDGLLVNEAFVARVRDRMQELVAADLPIQKQALPSGKAIALFKEQGMEDKEKLFWYRRGSYINVYELDGYYDYYFGYMVPSTGYLPCFDLIPYEQGMMLLVPEMARPEQIPVFEDRKKLFRTLQASDLWGEKMGISTVGELNDKICEGDLAQLILVQEALQESRIGEIAAEIASRKHVKFVMIAGPSSSGKTTFSHRLSIQLKTHGLVPHPIAVDDYFVDREKTPKDADGNYNFECLEAIDIEQFNCDMRRLLDGERVELPCFNFKTGKREYRGNYKQLGEDDILVIEGIHGLNDAMSYALPLESKYKIYISALTSLNVDGHNRISTTDGRLLRRMVRDARTRGASAAQTIRMWPSVRRGEEENIFPYQESADAMFNSALIYELAVLKQFAEPLLFGIGKDEAEYFEAKRLLKFLDYFLGVSSENLPNNSIVREFVGGSCFRV